MSTKHLLISSLFQNTYKLFGIPDDQLLILRMTQILLIYTLGLGLYSLVKAAPYGKHLQAPNILYGPLLNPKLSWMIQEAPSWIVPVLLLYQSPAVQLRNPANLILLVCFLVHYMHRSLIYPLRMNSAAKQVPLLISANAFLFCAFNGLLQGHSILNVHRIDGTSTCFIPGVVIFTIGLIINIHHDGILLSLRKVSQDTKGGNDEGKSKYQIPRGGLFDFISGANYAGEILEWWGLGLATREAPQIAFAIFSTVMLGFRAWHTHQFYHRTFGSTYPKLRKALIPLIL